MKNDNYTGKRYKSYHWCGTLSKSTSLYLKGTYLYIMVHFRTFLKGTIPLKAF